MFKETKFVKIFLDYLFAADRYVLDCYIALFDKLDELYNILDIDGQIWFPIFVDSTSILETTLTEKVRISKFQACRVGLSDDIIEDNWLHDVSKNRRGALKVSGFFLLTRRGDQDKVHVKTRTAQCEAYSKSNLVKKQRTCCL
jgi:hypothetical protein